VCECVFYPVPSEGWELSIKKRNILNTLQTRITAHKQLLTWGKGLEHKNLIQLLGNEANE